MKRVKNTISAPVIIIAGLTGKSRKKDAAKPSIFISNPKNAP
jgi:hypothetical protein